MKFLNFESLAEIAELCIRQNGKTTAAVNAALNLLMNISGDATVLFVSYNNPSSEDARRIIERKLTEANPDYGIKIEVNNSGHLRFSSITGVKSVRFCAFPAISIATKGCTLDDIIFDVDPGFIFKSGYPNAMENLIEIYQCLAPTMNKRNHA